MPQNIATLAALTKVSGLLGYFIWVGYLIKGLMLPSFQQVMPDDVEEIRVRKVSANFKVTLKALALWLIFATLGLVIFTTALVWLEEWLTA